MTQTVNKLDYLMRVNQRNLNLMKNQTIDISDEEYKELYPLPNNIIKYEASAKLSGAIDDDIGFGLHANAFSGANGKLTMVSHTFENGVGTIEFNDDVTSIGDMAFFFCTSLTSIVIPNSVTNINGGAFDGCDSLPIENNIRYADTYAVEAVDKTLTTYTIKEGTKCIGDSAFQYCNRLTSVTIPDSVTSIGNFAFRGCEGLTSCTIGNSVTSIGNFAFRGCESLTSIEIPDSVTSIGSSAFSDCKGLTSVTIGSGVTSIGNYVFEDCSKLTSITVDSNNTVFDSRNNCNAIIKTSTNKLIHGCKNTVIPNTVTSIGQYAFHSCTSLTSINIPSGVTSIGGDAFSCCSGLTSITIPNSVTSIGNYAFESCSSLTSITSNATKAPTIQSSTFEDVKTGGTLTVPSGSSGYDVWMGTGNYYLGQYRWTKREQ